MPTPTGLFDEDKQFLKNCLLDAVIYFANQRKFSDQLIQVLDKVAFYEFPK